LIKKLLVIDPEQRLTAHQALSHPWFTSVRNQDDATNKRSATEAGGAVKVKDETLAKLKSFKGISTFKNAAMNLLVKTATDEEVQDLRAQFQAIDTDGTGMIEAQELHDILMQKRLNASDAEVTEIITQMDYHKNQKINYSEFLAATIDVQDFLTESRL